MKYESKLKISRVILNHFSSSHVCIWLRYRCSFGSEFIAKTYLMRPAWCEMSISGSFDAFVISLLFTSNTITQNRQSRKSEQPTETLHTHRLQNMLFFRSYLSFKFSQSHTPAQVSHSHAHTHTFAMDFGEILCPPKMFKSVNFSVDVRYSQFFFIFFVSDDKSDYWSTRSMCSVSLSKCITHVKRFLNLYFLSLTPNRLLSQF